MKITKNKPFRLETFLTSVETNLFPNTKGDKAKYNLTCSEKRALKIRGETNYLIKKVILL